MKKFIFPLLLINAVIVYGQKPAPKDNDRVKSGFGVSVVQVQPQFPGGADSLQSFMKANMTYPAQAKLNHIQGRVYAGFMVDRKGKIKDIRILSGVNEELDNEAIRVLKLMPDWTPGSAGGSAVDVQYILPVDFILPKDMK
ncbi:MAG TPA: energy transducer TonB [Bacteroidia bacterium]|nr:energy transducer TonB [Bacteroidia bacterium]